MPPHNVAALVHLIGFLTGAALYAMLFALVVRRRVGDDRLPLVTAILGLIWNVSGLAAFGIRDFAGGDASPFLIATAYSALGFLPAVVVHTVLRSQSEARHRRTAAAIVWGSYAISTVAETLMFRAASSGAPVPSVVALQTLTWFYLALTIPLFLLTRRRTGSARGWSIVALAVFAVSALHLSHREGATESWFIELAGHHASIPLIFAILYQDFRFALADLFLKRAIALFALVAIASGLYVGVEVPLLAQHDFRSDPVAVGVSVILWAGLALLYPPLCRGAAWIVDRVVLHRVDYKRLREDFDQSLGALEEPPAVMNALADALRSPLAADEMRWIEEGLDAGDDVMSIRTTEPPRYALVIGPLAGGRRLLSDDLAMLENMALLAARRIDTIRLERERYQQSRLATEAELRALRAQVNPHFLFNAMNTIGYLIQTSPTRAHGTLMKLTALLRGVLRSADAATTLGDEIDLVSAYLEIERARFEERLRIDIDVPGELRGIRVPALMIQPLVENAIKHGIANCRSGGRVSIESRSDGDILAITVRNSGARATESDIIRGRQQGVGLSNLDARLRHQYGDAASLTLVATADETRAEILLPIARRA
ncbi:MAG: two-component system, LytTR family, sensor kinase [Thermoanaerobaculia bacterium]|jgi:two-component system LytT family sensor kinase|nr:two-component system, LytTR family, sensor kinase [Thermoanaerobaculia bacterium]